MTEEINAGFISTKAVCSGELKIQTSAFIKPNLRLLILDTAAAEIQVMFKEWARTSICLDHNELGPAPLALIVEYWSWKSAIVESDLCLCR